VSVAEETFGARLKRLREQAGLTQQQLAEKAGVHRFSIAKVEQDLHMPSWPTIQALAKALDISCAAFEGTVEPPPRGAKPPGKMGRPRKAPPAGEGEADQPPEQPAGEAEQSEGKPRRRKGK
jgi:transcriptional regulator with XRE-family HTH domain